MGGMVKGLGERSASKAESGGWTQENMSQVEFAGNAMKMPMKTPEQRAAEARAQQEKIAKLRAELMKFDQKVNSDAQNLNRTATSKIEQMGGKPVVQLDTGTQQPKKRFGLFGRH